MTGTDNTWYYWSSGTTSAATDNYTWSSSQDGIWRAWNTDSGTSASITISSDTIWAIWTTGSDNTIAVNRQGGYWVQPETEEQRQAREQREQERREREAEQKRKQEEADKRADDLLKSLLTPEQVKQLDEMACFIVTTPKGNTYKIKRGWAGNIEELTPEGKAKARLCIHPKVSVPVGDNMAAQKLMLETNEDEFLKIANRTPLAV